MEFYGTSFRKYVHSHWLIDVCFGMLNTVLTSPLSHWRNNNYYCIMSVSGHLLRRLPLACYFINIKKIFQLLFIFVIVSGQ